MVTQFRTEEKFLRAPIWIIPTKTDYVSSIIEPDSDCLPYGTTAIQYDVDLTINNTR